MNNQDLAAAVAGAHGISQKDAKAIVETITKSMTTALHGGDEVSLNGFGKFKVSDVPAREGRNPRTGESMTFAASRKAKFTAAKALKEALN